MEVAMSQLIRCCSARNRVKTWLQQITCNRVWLNRMHPQEHQNNLFYRNHIRATNILISINLWLDPWEWKKLNHNHNNPWSQQSICHLTSQRAFCNTYIRMLHQSSLHQEKGPMESQPSSRKEVSTTLAATDLTHWPPVSARYLNTSSFPKSRYILRLISSCQTSSKYHSFQFRISTTAHHPWLDQQSSWYAARWCHFNRLLQILIWLSATWTASTETCFIGTTGQPAPVDRGLSDWPRSAGGIGCHNFSGIWCSAFPLGNFLPDLSTWSAGVRIIWSWNVCWFYLSVPRQMLPPFKMTLTTFKHGKQNGEWLSINPTKLEILRIINMRNTIISHYTLHDTELYRWQR